MKVFIAAIDSGVMDRKTLRPFILEGVRIDESKPPI